MALPDFLHVQLIAATDINEVKSLVLLADEVISDLHVKLAEAYELIEALSAGVEENSQDSDRYALLKLILPTFMEIAAYAGSQGGDAAQAAFSKIDPLKLDEILDIQLDAGVLEELQDALEAEAVASLDEAGQAADVAVGVNVADEDDDVCGDSECPYCFPQYNVTPEPFVFFGIPTEGLRMSAEL